MKRQLEARTLPKSGKKEVLQNRLLASICPRPDALPGVRVQVSYANSDGTETVYKGTVVALQFKTRDPRPCPDAFMVRFDGHTVDQDCWVSTTNGDTWWYASF